jgi:RimJ/RimL family protein N-acetyltransferase
MLTGEPQVAGDLRAASSLLKPLPEETSMLFRPELPIQTERLALRAFTRGDVDAVFAYRQRDDVAAYLFDEPMSRETCAEIVQVRTTQVGWQDEGDRLVLAVERRADHAMLGEVSLILRNQVARQGEIGYILHPQYQGAGFATEAVRALIGQGFGEGGLHRIFARCTARNSASYRLMERVGMRREAHFREHVLVRGVWDDELIYALLEDEWTTLANNQPA